MTNIGLTLGQIKTIRKKLLDSASHILINPGESTPASRLLTNLNSDDNIKHVYITAEWEEGKELVQLYQRAKPNQRAQQAIQETLAPRTTDSCDINNNQLTILKEALDDTHSIVKALGLKATDGQRVLLACAWMSTEQLRYFRLYPHILGSMDVTFRTNSEKRPLFRAVLRTADGYNIPCIDVFLPSQVRPQHLVISEHYSFITNRTVNFDSYIFTLLHI